MMLRETEKALRSPLIVVVVAKIRTDKKGIPEIEQILSAGAATQNIVTALVAQQYGCMWKTGAAAYDSNVKSALGIDPSDHIVAFLHVGTTEVPGDPNRTADFRDFVEDWT